MYWIEIIRVDSDYSELVNSDHIVRIGDAPAVQGTILHLTDGKILVTRERKADFIERAKDAGIMMIPLFDNTK